MSGRIVRSDTVEHLLQPARSRYVVHITCAGSDVSVPEKLSQSFPELHVAVLQEGLMRIEAREPVRVGPVVRFLEDQGAEVLETRRVRPSLEDVFVDITGVGVAAMKSEKPGKAGNQ